MYSICGSVDFFTEKTDLKNVATLRTRCTETKSCKKLVFQTQKSPAHAA